MIEDLSDHRWIFDARDDLDRTPTMLAGQDVDLEYTLQPLGPRHRDVVRGFGFVAGLGLASAAPGRRHLFPQSMIWREHPVIAREVDARRRHQGGQAGHKVERLEYHVSRAIPVGRFQTVANIPLGGKRQAFS